MSQDRRLAGPQFRADQPVEQETVRTTIVGGRPPGAGQPMGDIPRGIEVLIKKAAVDEEFRKRLLLERAAAAEAIGLALDPAETMMLTTAPAEQLEAVIRSTKVPQAHRRSFLGHAAAAMLAALGVTGGTAAEAGDLPSPFGQLPFSQDRRPTSYGIRPSRDGFRPYMPAMIRPAVLRIVAQQLITGDLSLTEDLGADQARLAALERALATEFNITINRTTFEMVETIDDLIELVRRLRPKQRSYRVPWGLPYRNPNPNPHSVDPFCDE